jgi:hypothetical protein
MELQRFARLVAGHLLFRDDEHPAIGGERPASRGKRNRWDC